MPEEQKMTPEEKKKDLYDRQVDTLKKFLERNAISQQQYDKSLHDLTEKWALGNKNQL